MDIKLILQARLDSLNAVLLQAGKRLSAATITKLKTAVDTLEKLLGMDDVTDDAMEQAWNPIGEMLFQAIGDVELMGGSYENLTSEMYRALISSANKHLPEGYKYPVHTFSDHVVFRSEGGYPDYEYKFFKATWERGEDGNIKIGEPVPVKMTEAVISLQSLIEKADELLQSAEPNTGEKEEMHIEVQSQKPETRLLEQENGDTLLLQMFHDPITILQSKSESGQTIIQGIATRGNVLNLNTPPVVYPTKLWEDEAARMQALITEGKAYGCFVDETGHPTVAGQPAKARTPKVSEYSHRYTDLTQDGDMFRFTAVVMNTTAGKELQAYLDAGAGLENSSVAGGKMKAGEWEGQPALIVQSKGFKWHRIADVVLKGASPGSAITDVRLQSLTAESIEGEDKNMDPEQIKQAIADAMAAGNTALAAQLQAITDQMANLTQSAGLSDEDKALLQEVRDAKILQAMNVAIEGAVDKMIADKELPSQFRISAVTYLQSACQKAEDVDRCKAGVTVALKPLIDSQALLQSKGMYVPEFNNDGTTKKTLRTSNDVIDDLLQSAVERGTLEKDNGVDEPSNHYRNTKIMLQTMAIEHPEYTASYAQMRNRRIKTPEDMRHYLSQSFDILSQDIPAGAMTTTDVAAAIPYIMGIVTEMTGELVARRYTSVQPMSRSKGNIAYWKIKDQDGNNIREAANFTGSYANDPGEKQTIKRIKGALTTEDISPTAKKLGYDLSVEVIRRLRTDWGIDGSSIMVAECAKEIAMEINYNQLQSMVSGATAGNWNYGTAVPSDSSYSGEEWQRQITNYIQSVRAGIFKKTFAGTKAILGDADAIARILSLSKEVGMMSDTPGAGIIARGVDVVGRLQTGEELVSVAWWESLGMANKLLFIGGGQEWYKTGFVYAPYLGLYVTPTWVDPNTLDVEQGLLSEGAEKMVDGNYFATMTIQSGVAGTPI